MLNSPPSPLCRKACSIPDYSRHHPRLFLRYAPSVVSIRCSYLRAATRPPSLPGGVEIAIALFKVTNTYQRSGTSSVPSYTAFIACREASPWQVSRVSRQPSHGESTLKSLPSHTHISESPCMSFKTHAQITIMSPFLKRFALRLQR